MTVKYRTLKGISSHHSNLKEISMVTQCHGEAIAAVAGLADMVEAQMAPNGEEVTMAAGAVEADLALQSVAQAPSHARVAQETELAIKTKTSRTRGDDPRTVENASATQSAA